MSHHEFQPGQLVSVNRARKPNEGFMALVVQIRDGAMDVMVNCELVTLIRTIEYDKKYGTVWCLSQNWVPLNIEILEIGG